MEIDSNASQTEAQNDIQQQALMHFWSFLKSLVFPVTPSDSATEAKTEEGKENGTSTPPENEEVEDEEDEDEKVKRLLLENNDLYAPIGSVRKYDSDEDEDVIRDNDQDGSTQEDTQTNHQNGSSTQFDADPPSSEQQAHPSSPSQLDHQSKSPEPRAILSPEPSQVTLSVS